MSGRPSIDAQRARIGVLPTGKTGDRGRQPAVRRRDPAAGAPHRHGANCRRPRQRANRAWPGPTPDPCRHPGRSYRAIERRSGNRACLRRCDDPPGIRGGRRRESGAHAHAIGRSRGGLTTWNHAAEDCEQFCAICPMTGASGLPIRSTIDPGHRGGCAQARGLIDGLTGIGRVVADAARDADRLRASSADALGAPERIGRDPSRIGRPTIDRALCRGRHLVERSLTASSDPAGERCAARLPCHPSVPSSRSPLR